MSHYRLVAMMWVHKMSTTTCVQCVNNLIMNNMECRIEVHFNIVRPSLRFEQHIIPPRQSVLGTTSLASVLRDLCIGRKLNVKQWPNAQATSTSPHHWRFCLIRSIRFGKNDKLTTRNLYNNKTTTSRKHTRFPLRTRQLMLHNGGSCIYLTVVIFKYPPPSQSQYGPPTTHPKPTHIIWHIV